MMWTNTMRMRWLGLFAVAGSLIGLGYGTVGAQSPGRGGMGGPGMGGMGMGKGGCGMEMGGMGMSKGGMGMGRPGMGGMEMMGRGGMGKGGPRPGMGGMGMGRPPMGMMQPGMDMGGRPGMGGMVMGMVQPGMGGMGMGQPGMGGMGMAMGQPNFNPGANLNQARMDAFNAKQGQMKQQNLVLLLKHLSLVITLEQEFGVSFTVDQTIEILNYPLIKIVLAEHGIEFSG